MKEHEYDHLMRKLVRQTTLEEILKDKWHPRGPKWDAFVSKMGSAELWEYYDIGFLSGSAGYVLVQDEHVIGVFKTAMS